MSRARSTSHAEQRAAMLARAAELFARQGYAGTSMNEIAAACGVSKATLYHYVLDKAELLAQIAQGHIDRLEAVLDEVEARRLPPRPRLQQLIERFVRAYAGAQHEHRVLTEDVRFLDAAARQRVLDGERRVVRAFAAALAELHPELSAAALDKPLTMLLFGMINWTFTWLKPGRELDHARLAPLVAEFFFGGLQAVADGVRNATLLPAAPS